MAKFTLEQLGASEAFSFKIEDAIFSSILGGLASIKLWRLLTLSVTEHVCILPRDNLEKHREHSLKGRCISKSSDRGLPLGRWERMLVHLRLDLPILHRRHWHDAEVLVRGLKGFSCE